MITRPKGELCVTCDRCGEQAFGGVLEWADFWAGMKEDGWRAHKNNEEWTHSCPSCEAFGS